MDQNKNKNATWDIINLRKSAIKIIKLNREFTYVGYIAVRQQSYHFWSCCLFQVCRPRCLIVLLVWAVKNYLTDYMLHSSLALNSFRCQLKTFYVHTIRHIASSALEILCLSANEFIVHLLTYLLSGITVTLDSSRSTGRRFSNCAAEQDLTNRTSECTCQQTSVGCSRKVKLHKQYIFVMLNNSTASNILLKNNIGILYLNLLTSDSVLWCQLIFRSGW